MLGTGLLLFGLGLGWSISFVAATAQLADRAAPGERGKLGVAALAIGATVAVLLPVATLLRRRTDVRRFSAAT